MKQYKKQAHSLKRLILTGMSKSPDRPSSGYRVKQGADNIAGIKIAEN